MQRQRGGASFNREFAGENLQASVDHVKAPAHEQEARGLKFPARAERNGHELQADERSAGDHHAVDAQPRQKSRHRQSVDQAANRKPRDDDAGNRQPGFAEFEQERGNVGKQPKHAATLDEDRGETQRIWIGKNGSITLPERR